MESRQRIPLSCTLLLPLTRRCMFVKASTYAPEKYENGIRLQTYPHSRFLPTVKSLNYMSGVIALKGAKEKGAEEILYVSNGHLLEGATVNFFAIIDSDIYTAKDKVLCGITR